MRLCSYLRRSLLSSSFVPFIVTFLHVIAAKDRNSISLLQQVLDALQTFRATSCVSENLYQICGTFTQVASKLVSSQQWPPTMDGVNTTQQQQQQQQNHGQDSLHLSDISYTPSIFGFFQHALFAGASQDAGLGTTVVIDLGYTANMLNDWLRGPPFLWEGHDTGMGLGQVGAEEELSHLLGLATL
ncbi:hypothetical protein BJY01DRAFT_248361 [Aspergillus pseudoustus]|uniref:Uncharacterized protein n=1 Tax=Aspergillus pseudoustus TaxID=1810923 RepID=A0ABR4JVM4_9EURO